MRMTMRFFSRPVVVFLLVAMAGLVIRLDHIDRAFELQPARQYRDAILARGIYAATSDQLTPEHRHLAVVEAAPDAEPVYEPEVLETAAATGYSLVGGEMLWIPRLLAALAWLVGGSFLFLMGREMRNTATAVTAVAFYLFTPFAVVGSRALQPDSLMVAGYLLIAYLLYADKRGGNRRFLVAMASSALVTVIKPQAAALTIPLFLALSVYQRGFRRGLLGARAALFVVVTVVPAAIWILTRGAGATSDVFFAPSLFFNGFFLRGWSTQLTLVVGSAVLLAAVGGAFLYARGRTAALMIGLAVGYCCLRSRSTIASRPMTTTRFPRSRSSGWAWGSL